MTTLDLMGWDLVCATTFARLSDGINASPRRAATFTAADTTEDVGLSGSWGRWELASGSPGNMLWLDCTVSAGSFTHHGTEYDLMGAVFTVQFGLAWAGAAAAGGGSLRPASSGDASPRLIGQAGVSVTGTDAYILSGLMNQVLAGQVAALDSDFMSIAVGGTGQPQDHPWLKPNESDYACCPLPGDPRKGIFGILSMTENRIAAGKQRAVDGRILDGSPDGSDAALVVGPELVIPQLITPTARTIIQDAKDDDFSVDPSGTVVYNNKTIDWGTLSYQDDGSTKQIKPVIPKGNVRVALDGELIHVSLADVHFPYPGWPGPGNINISFGAEQFCSYSFTLTSDRHLVMTPDNDKVNASYNVTVMPDQRVQIFQIALNVACQVVLSILGGVASQWLAACTAATEETAAGAVVSGMDEIEMANIAADNATPNEMQQAENQAAQQSAENIANAANPGYIQRFASAIAAYKYNFLIMAVKALIYLPISHITAVTTLAANHYYDKLPALDPFIDEAVKPVGWPMAKSFTITGGALRGSLTFYGKLS